MEKVMTALNDKNTFNPQLFILSAGLLLQAHSAFASDPSNDAQVQARALLDPPVVHHVVARQSSSESSAHDATRMTADTQELARALLSGKSITHGAVPLASARNAVENSVKAVSDQDHPAYSNPQEAARRMILGPGAASVVARSVAATSGSPGVRTLSAR
jgi:hypothetical protein